MKNLKSLFIIPVGVVLALVVALLTSVPVPAAGARQDVRPTSGVLAGWRVDVDGTVYLRLRSQGEQFLWFRTPADKSQASRNVEEILIGAIGLGGEPGDESILTVIAKHERSLDGKDPDNAMPILSVSSP